MFHMRLRHFGYSRSYYMRSHNSTFHSRNDELMFQDQMRSLHSTLYTLQSKTKVFQSSE